MSSEKTTNYGFHQWKRDDLFLMEEFNENSAILDEALEACALVRLKTITVSGAVNQVSIDLTDVPVEKFGELHFRISGSHSGNGLRGVQMTFNGNTDSDSYLWADLMQGSTMTADSAMPLGNLTANTSGCQGGLKAEVSLYAQGISYRSVSAAAHTNTTSGAASYVGTLSVTNFLTADTLESVQFKMESSSLKFRAGTTITVYGVRV